MGYFVQHPSSYACKMKMLSKALSQFTLAIFVKDDKIDGSN
ncbi:hypothetical protein [Oceanobacillus sp. CAU 1775]